MNPPLFSLLGRSTPGKSGVKPPSAPGSTSSYTASRSQPIVNEGHDLLDQTSKLLSSKRSVLDEQMARFNERAARLAHSAPKTNKLTKGRLRPKQFHDSAQDLLSEVQGMVGSPPERKHSTRRNKASSISGATINSSHPEPLLATSERDARPGALAIVDSNRSHVRGESAGVAAAKPLTRASSQSSRRHKRSETVPSRRRSRSSFVQGSSRYPDGGLSQADSVDHHVKKKRAAEDLTRSDPASTSRSHARYDDRGYSRSKNQSSRRRHETSDYEHTSSRSHRHRDREYSDDDHRRNRAPQSSAPDPGRTSNDHGSRSSHDRGRDRRREEERAAHRERRRRSKDVPRDRDISRERERTPRDRDRRDREREREPHDPQDRHLRHKSSFARHDRPQHDNRRDDYYHDSRRQETDRYHTYSSKNQDRSRHQRDDPYREPPSPSSPSKAERPRTPSPPPLPVPPPNITSRVAQRSPRTKPHRKRKDTWSSSASFIENPKSSPPPLISISRTTQPKATPKRQSRRAYSIAASDVLSTTAPTYIPYDDVRSTRSFGQHVPFPTFGGAFEKTPSVYQSTEDGIRQKKVSNAAGSIRRWGKLSLWTKGKTKFVEHI